MLAVVFCSLKESYKIADKRRKNEKYSDEDSGLFNHVTRYLLKSTYMIVHAFLLFVFVCIVIYYKCSPEYLRDIEIAKDGVGTVAVICDYNNSKIAMKCRVSEDNRNLDIYYGEYQFIDPHEYQFTYMNFERIECSGR